MSIFLDSSPFLTLFLSTVEASAGKFRRDQMRTVWSSEQVATSVPQGENLTTLTSSRCPRKRWIGFDLPVANTDRTSRQSSQHQEAKDADQIKIGG